MSDAAAEDGLAGIGFVEMHRIHVAGHLAEQLDVALAHLFGEAVGLARFQFVEIDCHSLTI